MINRFLALQEEQPEYYTDEVIIGHVLVSHLTCVKETHDVFVLVSL